ncbi:sensor histidine kinase [Plantactinospora sp. GCM10030261]|uniref:sensor histidine kinase n=1 Tax=Plantactinospora sp. GCM10030261 TaxID=3273420 RepID=UPI003615373B
MPNDARPERAQRRPAGPGTTPGRSVHNARAAGAPDVRTIRDVMDPAVTAVDRRLRRARVATLAVLASGVWASVLLPGMGLARETDGRWVALGAAGLVAFVTAQAAALYAAVTPWLADRARLWCQLGFAVAAVLSVPLLAPVGDGAWPTWAWVGASIVGTAPLLGPLRVALPTMAVTVAVALALARWTSGDPGHYLTVTGGVGAGIAAVNWLQVWFWDLLVRAWQGQDARGRLAAAEERLRFARDVHDLLGHDLTVIALKAELAARLAPVDAARAAREATEAQRLAAGALADVRRAVHGYRAVDLTDQLEVVGRLLRSSGVRCTVVPPTGELPAEVATQLATVLREASTNVLRHSRAGWCRIEVSENDGMATMTVTNDGATGRAPDRHSHGLAGLADRLSATGGSLRTSTDEGVFTLVATVPGTP